MDGSVPPADLALAQVLAFRLKRSNDLAVVALDDSYAMIGAPTVFTRRQLPINLTALEDPRLFVHRGELYLLAHGAKRKEPGAQYLARLERESVSVAASDGAEGAGPNGSARHAGASGPARFRLLQPRELQLPVNIRLLARALPKDILDSSDQKNWVPFIYNDNMHFMYCMNPPVVVRIPAGLAAVEDSGPIRTEFVSAAGNATARWRYGDIRGGTPALYDAALGGYVAFFHSHVKFPVLTPTGWRGVLSYYLGCCVFAAQPPFGIQLISEVPLVGPGFYNESLANIGRRRVIFAQGVMVLPDAFIVSYGKDDESMRVVRFDRRKLADSLQPPLPRNWEGAPC